MSPQKPSKRRLWLILVGAVFCLALVAWLLYWFFVGRFYVATDNAYVTGNQVMITPQVSSGTVCIYADNTDFVEEGQVLVLLDSSNYLIALAEKKALLADTVRAVVGLFTDVEKNQALVEVRKSEMIQAELNLSHRVALVDSQAVAVEEFEQMQTDVKVATSNYLYANKLLEASKALVENTFVETHPRVLDAASHLRQAYLDLIRCSVIAPTRGYIAKRSVQVGDWVAAGSTLMTLVPLDFLWIEANFKETQLERIRIGQDVTFTADIYGSSISYTGKVVGFSGGTGSAFALLPAQNASGNWIKIVQRLPVRIAIELQEIEKNPLFIGLSTEVNIDVRDVGGEMLSRIPQIDPVYTTYLYKTQMQKLESFEGEIVEIIKTNNTFSYATTTNFGT